MDEGKDHEVRKTVVTESSTSSGSMKTVAPVMIVVAIAVIALLIYIFSKTG